MTEKIKPKMLFLCSLSPYFKEDLKFLKKSWRNGIGKKRIEDLENFSFEELAKDIKCKNAGGYWPSDKWLIAKDINALRRQSKV